MAKWTTLTVWTFRGWKNRSWAFRQMGIGGYTHLPGLEFGKLLGCGGGNGFSLWPHFGQYAFLGVWESQSAAEENMQHHPWWHSFASHCEQQCTLVMQPFKTHGTWHGKNPFESGPAPPANSWIAVITRARIKPAKLWRFWSFVPAVSQQAAAARNALLSMGVGELPVIEQATFSIWESAEALREFAYTQQLHPTVVRLTREEGWYSEELFVRFHVTEVHGNWRNLKESFDKAFS
jgi:hypothetical protein